ncbi:hypothetical protein [Ruegeria sp.]|uniref:hypothetical protein n=1 Tax=Ruegeria sp. TaxID=1879320 RepID=UPI00230BD44D|nr:hypothetical protein [Ruegeria sp.]MDA7965222.1 hypothetical protein [Ruegeria sp.]
MKTPEDGGAAPETHAKLLSMIPQGKPVERVILSAAALIGEHPAIIADGQLYPHAGQRMALLDRALPDVTVELFVGLCNPGTFIPKALMQLSDPQRRAVVTSTDLSCLGWLPMIEDIRDLAPDVKITLWRNEDSPLIWGDILRAIADVPQDTPVVNEFGLLSSLVSEAGQHQIEMAAEVAPSERDATFREALAQVFQDHALPEAIEEELDLPGWSNDLVAAFTELYEQDVARLQSMPDIRFLAP